MNHTSFSIMGNLVDIHQQRIYPAKVEVENGKIKSITETTTVPEVYILPGFVDAHVHVESSMLVPTAFGAMAAVHGTVATISDPHEIANVCGESGVYYMIENARETPFKCFFGAPSCVPATIFETAGATLDSVMVDKLLQHKDIWYLTEVMNYPGVLYKDEEVMAKIAAAKRHNKPIDGHAPGLMGNEAQLYAAADITTDHECTTLEEALDKINAGMHILIREGSAAKNFDALHTLIGTHPKKVMLCSDDKHPDDLVQGHINQLVKRALALGYNFFDVICAASNNPVMHYNLPVGLLRVGDAADFILTSSADKGFEVLATYIDGLLVAEDGNTLLTHITPIILNNFDCNFKALEDFNVKYAGEQTIPVIEALDGQLITKRKDIVPLVSNTGHIVNDIVNDVLKITVVNRYDAQSKPAVSFITNFGLKHGAIASTVAHDCHNIIAVGTNDNNIVMAVNKLIEMKGGIVVVDAKGIIHAMPLPIGGLMTTVTAKEAAEQYSKLNMVTKEIGCTLTAPFMTLSFMALLVIPAIKLSDKGLFDGNRFSFV